MRNEQIYSDPAVEHVFKPEVLFDLMADLGAVTFPLGFVRELGSARTLIDLLDTTTAWLRHLLPIDRASLSIPDGTGMVQIWSLRGSSASKADKSLPMDYGRPGRVIRDHVVILSPHLSRCTQPDGQSLYKAGLVRTINAPLLFAGKCYGSLNVVSARFEDLGLREAATLLSLANWLAPAFAALSCDDRAAEEMQRERALTEAARSESAMKSSFIANVSHEIRTPLNAILGMAQMLEADALPSEQAKKVDVVLYSARSLLTVLNDILDLSKIEAGKLCLTPLRNRPTDAFAHIVNLWRDRASQKGLILALHIDPTISGSLIYDAVRVQQCVSNLLSNAIKFTTEGRIEVHVSSVSKADSEIVEVRVRDNGPGVAAVDAEAIFEPFRQGRSPHAALIKGTGLGLSISRKLARMMGGDVLLDPTPGPGAVFTLRFAARVARDLEQTDPIADTDSPAVRGSKGARAIPDGLRILLVEDVPTNRIVVRLLLQKHGVHLTEAENGQVALERLAEAAFDVILLDMQMPVMDGAETIRRIRATPGPMQTVPVIALTASAMVGDRERFLTLGIDGYIPKPVEEADLLAEILTVLN